jgi:hypothetical protein
MREVQTQYPVASIQVREELEEGIEVCRGRAVRSRQLILVLLSNGDSIQLHVLLKYDIIFLAAERYPSGPRGLTRNQLGVARRAWVRIPPSPPLYKPTNRRLHESPFYINKEPFAGFSGRRVMSCIEFVTMTLLISTQRFGLGIH